MIQKFNIEDAILIASIICGRDGVISGEELEVMFLKFQEFDSSLTRDLFEETIDRYFSEEPTLTDLVSKFTNNKDQEVIVTIASDSAAADGLDVKENIALEKLKKEWSTDD